MGMFDHIPINWCLSPAIPGLRPRLLTHGLLKAGCRRHDHFLMAGGG